MKYPKYSYGVQFEEMIREKRSGEEMKGEEGRVNFNFDCLLWQGIQNEKE